MGSEKPIDFVIAGAQKGGTTALHYYLEQHPEVGLPRKQELHFFDDEERFAREVDYSELHAFFDRRETKTVSGECTPVYIYWRSALERIHDYNPAIKILLTLRNPITRAFSQWNMQRQRGLESLDFTEAVHAEPERSRASVSGQSRRHSYADRGFYARQLERIFTLFPREQVKVIKFETFRSEPQETMRSVFEFLGVPPLARLKVREKNSIPYDRPITAEERAQIAPIFAEDIAKLERMLGWDCSDWK